MEIARPHRAVRKGTSWAAFIVLTMTLGIASAQAQVVQGTLELQWGDPHPAQRAQQGVFTATIITDAGIRVPLEPEQARRAAGDLYALANRRVAVEFSAQQKSSPLRQAAVIVSAEKTVARAAPVNNGGRVMAAAPVSGNTRWVTLMCRFSDIATEQKDKVFFQSQYGTGAGELGHYWKEVSYGKIDLAGSAAYGWFVLPQPREFYITKNGDKDKANLDQLFKDCGAAADAEVNFTGVLGVNMMFNGNLDGFAWGGGGCATLEGVNMCKKTTWNPPWAFNNLAPLAHEMGHAYGLPHSDNSDGDDDTYDNPWDVMSDGWRNATSSTTFGALPKHINIYQRERLGWVDAARKQSIAGNNDTRVRINLDFASLAGSTNKQMVVLAMPQGGDPYQNTIYTLEARNRTGTYESKLAGDAVIIHALQNYGNAKSMDMDVPAANVANNEGSMFKVGETWTSPDQNQTHWVQVEEATATGFVVSVGPKPRVTGGNQRARLQSAASAGQQAPSSAAPLQQVTSPVAPQRRARMPATVRQVRMQEQ